LLIQHYIISYPNHLLIECAHLRTAIKATASISLQQNVKNVDKGYYKGLGCCFNGTRIRPSPGWKQRIG